MAGIIDFKEMFEPIKKVLIQIIKLPFELWYAVPLGYKLVVGVIFVVFLVLILMLVLVNKKKWMHKRF